MVYPVFPLIGNALKGDFGQSFIFKLPVSTLLAGRISNTLWLSLLTVILTYVIAIPLGMWAGRYQNSLLDKVVVVYNFFSFAVPLFIFALIALFIFGYRLAWFPTGGSVAPGSAAWLSFGVACITYYYRRSLLHY